MAGEMISEILNRIVEASSEIGDPLFQSAVMYFGFGEVHLDRQSFSVLGMLVASLIEELI